MEIKKGKTLKGKIIAAATAISLFTGVTVSSTFDSASDIMMSDIKEPTPIVEVVDLKKAEAPPVVEKIAEEEEKRLTLKQRLAQKIMALPAGVRAVVVVPLYALGALVSRTAGAAFSGTRRPVKRSNPRRTGSRITMEPMRKRELISATDTGVTIRSIKERGCSA